MDGSIALVLSIIGLAVTLVAHLVGTIWWASRLTARVEHIERWIAANEQTGARLATLEATLRAMGDSLRRIETHLIPEHGR